MHLSLTEIAAAVGARVTGPLSLPELRAQTVSGWSIDTRSIQPGDLFIAIEGEHLDGHAFLAAAFAAGAPAALVSKSVPASGMLLLHVEDSVRALGEMAHAARQRWQKPLVAITGSAGKTSTKEIVAALLATKFRVGKTAGNLNNHIGLPLTLLRLPDEAEVAVVEMGMNHAGEIAYLTRIAEPQIGLVTNVGYAHVEAFDGIEGVASAKRELIGGLPSDGIAVLNADDEHVAHFAEGFPGRVLTYGMSASADFRCEAVESGPEGSVFSVCGVRFETQLAGRHAISNILAALAVASLFDLPPASLVESVRSLEPGKMRGAKRTLRGFTVIDDSYNSNPEAARSMLDVLRAEPARRRIAVLGEMLELGAWSERLHRELGRYAATASVDVLVGVGGDAHHTAEEALRAGLPARQVFFFADARSAGEFLRGFLHPGDAVLLKGSRGTHLSKRSREWKNNQCFTGCSMSSFIATSPRFASFNTSPPVWR